MYKFTMHTGTYYLYYFTLLQLLNFHSAPLLLWMLRSVDGPTPAARVTWSTTAPPECVASVRVEFRTSSRGLVVATNTTNSTSQTEIIQTGLRCVTYYYITVKVTGKTSDGQRPTKSSRAAQVLVGGKNCVHEIQLVQQLDGDCMSHCADIPHPFGVRAEATSDNTSIRVSWQWSRQGLLTCVDLVRVHYQPQRGSVMYYTVDNTRVTSAILSNLQCNTEYTIWVHASGGQTDTRSVSRMFAIPARGRTVYVQWSLIQCTTLTLCVTRNAGSKSKLFLFW